MAELDHLVISTTDLGSGVEEMSALLGVPFTKGGEHALFGTHNWLLSLGPEIYLEVIAINPDAPDPGRPRWYALDEFEGQTRLTNWAVRSDDLGAALDAAPDGTGVPIAVTRGDLSWVMAVPTDGRLPLGGHAPALLEWKGTAHPCQRLPDQGVRLVTLEVSHPEIALLGASPDPRVVYVEGAPGFRARFSTPAGEVVL